MKHFELTEFESPDHPGSGFKMNYDFLEMMDQARELTGRAIRINSGYRTPQHNESVGGLTTSSHLIGCAADIACSTSTGRSELIAALIGVGFRRIGIAKNFIHVDNDPNKVDAIWLYK